MKTFNIVIKEVLVKKIAIESNSINEALLQSNWIRHYENGSRISLQIKFK